ncbi:MAG: LysR family transcriptional regulator [Crenarchaeota archaeon]|nr:LysR family transcriptional regulator [Thermoproteota archaeon]
MRKIKFKIELVGEIDGVECIDSKVVKLLYLIDRYGSIYAASRSLGMAYSRAWELVSKLERALSTKIVERRRGGKGGGGAVLTSAGKAILEKYFSVYEKITGRKFEVSVLSDVYVPEVAYMGSNDPVVEKIFGIIRESLDTSIGIEWLGSGLGLSCISLGEADIAGIHLVDRDTGTYNIPYIEKMWLENSVVLVEGYLRDIGFITRRSLNYDDIIEGILSGELRIACRQRGSGTRTLLISILEKECRSRGLSFREVKQRIRGLDTEYKTHLDVVRAVASGEADVGLAIRWAAEQYRLDYLHVTWEHFDFVIRREILERRPIKEFLKVLSQDCRRIIEEFSGYRAKKNIGELVKIC